MRRISSILQAITALAVLAAAAGSISGVADQDQALKGRIAGFAANLTSYDYVIDSVADIRLSNGTADLGSNVSSRTVGSVDIAKSAASLYVANWRDGSVIKERSSYLVSGILYSDMGQGWQKEAVPNASQAMLTFDEMRGQSSMLVYSETGPGASDEVGGRSSTKIVSTPSEAIRGMLIRGQIIGAYYTLAGKMLNLTIDDVVKNSRLMNGSTVRLTSWIDQETGALLRNEMSVLVDVEPGVLRLPGEERLKIDLDQTSVFGEFNKPMGIELPVEAVNAASPAAKKDCPFCNNGITA